MALSEQEEQGVRKLLHQESLKESATLAAIHAVEAALNDLKAVVTTELQAVKDRVSRLERFQWFTLGGIAMIVTGLPAAAFLVKVVTTP